MTVVLLRAGRVFLAHSTRPFVVGTGRTPLGAFFSLLGRFA